MTQLSRRQLLALSGAAAAAVLVARRSPADSQLWHELPPGVLAAAVAIEHRAPRVDPTPWLEGVRGRTVSADWLARLREASARDARALRFANVDGWLLTLSEIGAASAIVSNT